MAAKLALLAFCKTLSNITVKLEVDNTVTQAYIVHQGGRIQCLNDIVQEIYEFLNSRNIKVVCAHLPGSENIHADKASRSKYDYDKEWQLKPDIFLKVEHGFGPFDVDLFASRINKQMDRFISWKPDPYAYAIDAFSVSWNVFINAYAFPPFSVISRVLQKIRDDKAAVTLVAPVWPTQAWSTQLLHLCVTIPKLLPAHQCVQLPHDPLRQHPLTHKLRLAVFKLSGQPSDVKEFRKNLTDYSCNRGAEPRGHRITHTSLRGMTFALGGALISFAQI